VGRAGREVRGLGVAMAILLHGTTQHRAERIATHGLDPDFRERDDGLRAEAFSTCLEGGPFPLGAPEEYACHKAALFPQEGGPAILVVDVPDHIIALALDEYFPLSQGVVQFDEGAGLEELRAAWPTLGKEIRSVQRP
jgi:hypothetical protein